MLRSYPDVLPVFYAFRPVPIPLLSSHCDILFQGQRLSAVSMLLRHRSEQQSCPDRKSPYFHDILFQKEPVYIRVLYPAGRLRSRIQSIQLPPAVSVLHPAAAPYVKECRADTRYEQPAQPVRYDPCVHDVQSIL